MTYAKVDGKKKIIEDCREILGYTTSALKDSKTLQPLASMSKALVTSCCDTYNSSPPTTVDVITEVNDIKE